jgi:hypothetical protein
MTPRSARFFLQSRHPGAQPKDQDRAAEDQGGSAAQGVDGPSPFPLAAVRTGEGNA